MRVLLEEYASTELDGIAPVATLVIPIGATEQHGPHLTVATDALVAKSVARAAAAEATHPDRPVIVAPVLSFGASDHHLPRGGTLSLRGTTYLAVLIDLLESAARSGFRRLVLLNGHGGNEDLARQAAREITVEQPLVVGATGYWTLSWGELVELCTEHGLGALPGHAGAFETSIVQHLAPERVDLSRVRDTRADGTDSRHPLSAPLVETHGWIDAIDGHSDGVHRADPAVGARAFELVVAAAAEFLREVASRAAPTHRPGAGRTRR